MERDILADVEHPFIVKLHYGKNMCYRVWAFFIEINYDFHPYKFTLDQENQLQNISPYWKI